MKVLFPDSWVFPDLTIFVEFEREKTMTPRSAFELISGRMFDGSGVVSHFFVVGRMPFADSFGLYGVENFIELVENNEAY